jgi:hypothetical protein
MALEPRRVSGPTNVSIHARRSVTANHACRTCCAAPPIATIQSNQVIHGPIRIGRTSQDWKAWGRPIGVHPARVSSKEQHMKIKSNVRAGAGKQKQGGGADNVAPEAPSVPVYYVPPVSRCAGI